VFTLLLLSGGVPRGPSVVTGSFVCGCGRTFGRSSDLTRHKKYCNDQPLHQNNEFRCGCGRLFRRKGDFTILFQLGLCHWSRSSDLGPCYCLRTGC